MHDEFLDSLHGVSHWWLMCAQSTGLRRSGNCSSRIRVAVCLYTDRALLFFVYNVSGKYWVNSWTVWIVGHHVEHYTTHSCYTQNTPELVSLTKTINLYVACFSVLMQDITLATIKRVRGRRPVHSQLSHGFCIAGSRDGVLLRAMPNCVSYFFWGTVLTTNYGASRRLKCY